MRTRNYFKYLLAAIVAIGTSVNGLAQEKNLRLYFNEYTGNDNAVPQLILKGDVPEGVAVTQEGYKWAGKYLATAFNKPNCEDRVWADKDGENRSHATLSFTNFKYEVKEVKWNRMNDVFSTQLWEKLKNSAQWNIFSAIGNFLSAFQYDVAFTPADVEQPSKSVTSGSWFVLGKQMSFAKASLISNANLAGLKSISLEEHYAREQKLEDYCRIFLKAGVKGEAEPSTNDYAFQVTYYEPTLAYTSAMPSNLVIGDQKNVAYQITHAGAFEFNEAHYTYSSSNPDVIEVGNDGVMKAKAVGEADITVKVEYNDYGNHMTELSVTKKVEVYSLNGALRYYHRDSYNSDKVSVSDMDHQTKSGDIDYTVENITPNSFTLKSSNSTKFRVGFLPFVLNVVSPKYTKVTPSWTFSIDNYSDNSVIYSGMEIMYLPNGKDYNNIKNINVNTSSGASTNSIIQAYSNSSVSNRSVNSETLNNSNLVFNNSDNNSISERQYAFAAIAYSRITNNKAVVYSNFGYTENTPLHEYFAYINYVKDDNCPFTMPANETISSTTTDGGRNLTSVSAKTGYTFNGWSLEEGGEVVYENGAVFSPYDAIDGGGKGYVTLYANWSVNTYRVQLRTGGNSTNGYTDDGYVIATYGELFPSVKEDGTPVSVPPTRKGYDFGGYYRGSSNPTYYYDNEMNAVNVWNRTDDYVSAKWINHTTNITFDPQGGNVYSGLTSITATYAKSMPLDEFRSDQNYNVPLAIPQRNVNGYTFGGYYDKPKGKGTQYYKYEDGKLASARSWNKDVETAILYAYWIPSTYTVTLKHNDGANSVDMVYATMGEPMPSVDINGVKLQAPEREGYTFLGYYSYNVWNAELNKNEDICWYDANMNSSNHNWITAQNAEIEAKWQANRYIVTLDGTEGAIVPNDFQYETSGTGCVLLQHSDGIARIEVVYDGKCPRVINNGRFKKAGFKLVGFRDAEGNIVATVDVNDASNRDIKFTAVNNYWKEKDGGLVWNYNGNLTLTADFVPKYTLEDGNIINFGSEYLELGIDWSHGEVNDAIGAVNAENAKGNISKENPVMVFDLRHAKYLDGSSKKTDRFMSTLEGNEYISPNALFYLGEGAYDINNCKNAIEYNGTCQNLVVTDRIPMKIPYAFTAQTATYERNKAFINDDNDAMWQQSKDSKWGTLCLPYPIKNNQKYDMNGVKYTIRFYELHNTYGNGQGQEYMQFYEMKGADQEIAANTPVLYCRTEGSAGSDITVKATDVEVHANADYGTKIVNYKEKVECKEAEESVMYWQFVGTLQTKEYCGAEYNGRVADGVYQNIENKMGATFIDHNKMEIYFFESDKFKKLSKKGKIILYPYRAFFEDHTITYLEQSGESKVSSYSILVVDADGTTTDITNLVGNSNAKGDGKIYDLSGRRVKQPVKGSIYIVDGKKKMY